MNLLFECTSVVFMKFLFLHCGNNDDDDGGDGSGDGGGGGEKTTKIYAKHQVVHSNENIKESTLTCYSSRYKNHQKTRCVVVHLCFAFCAL